MNKSKLLPYLVYEVFDIGVRLGIDTKPSYKLRCAFETEKLAKDFIDYQATISDRVYEIAKADEIKPLKQRKNKFICPSEGHLFFIHIK